MVTLTERTWALVLWQMLRPALSPFKRSLTSTLWEIAVAEGNQPWRKLLQDRAGVKTGSTQPQCRQEGKQRKRSEEFHLN